jgi:uncharacterized membrane protein HdeD (DUF308 family)
MPRVRYCQFGKRFLDGFSWLAPLTNNRIGDALNIEFVHEQVFLIEGDRVLRNIGYGEKGTRFSEEEFGKPICSLKDLEKQGYWLTGRPYHPEAVRRALEEHEDGSYYSFFSNQCQDWADRLKRRVERIEKELGLPPLGEAVRSGVDDRFWKEKPPTVPASVVLGCVSILLGIGAVLSPMIAAKRSLTVLGLFFIASSVSDVVYAVRGRVWNQFLQTVFFALLNLLAGVALLADRNLSLKWAGGLFAVALAVSGGSRILVALRSRPFRRWIGTLASGIGLLALAILLFTRAVDRRDAILGVLVGFNLVLAGVSTLWLRWSASRKGA